MMESEIIKLEREKERQREREREREKEKERGRQRESQGKVNAHTHYPNKLVQIGVFYHKKAMSGSIASATKSLSCVSMMSWAELDSSPFKISKGACFFR